MTTFRLLGEGALGSLRDRVRAVLDEWRTGWFVGAAPEIQASAHAPTAADLESLANLSWWRAESQDKCLYIGLPAEGLTRLAQRFLGVSTGDTAHPLLAAVAKDALTNLAERFLRGSAPGGAGVPLAEAAPPASMTRRGSGCARLSVNLDDLHLELWVDAAITADLAPRAATARLPLVSLESGIKDQRVQLRVELDLGTICAQRLRVLQPGDVVTTDAPLHTDFTVLLPSRGRIAAGRLGKQGMRRAVVLGN